MSKDNDTYITRENHTLETRRDFILPYDDWDLCGIDEYKRQMAGTLYEKRRSELEWAKHRTKEAKAINKACIDAMWKAASDTNDGVLAWHWYHRVWIPAIWFSADSTSSLLRNYWWTPYGRFKDGRLNEFMLMPPGPVVDMESEHE